MKIRINIFAHLLFITLLASATINAQETLNSSLQMSRQAGLTNWFFNNLQTDASGYRYNYMRILLSDLKRNHQLFIPVDDAFDAYIDPVAYGQEIQCLIKFTLDNQYNTVTANLYKYNKQTGETGELVTSLNSSSYPTFISNRLQEIIYNHIISGNISENRIHYVTLNNGFMGIPDPVPGSVQSEQDIMSLGKTKFVETSATANGYLSLIEKMLQPSYNSVYRLLESRTEFQAFFNLLKGVPTDYAGQFFENQGIDFRVKFFGAFHYTIYVPTNDAIARAQQSGVIKTWEQINALSNTVEKTAETEKLVRFLRYHFQDNAVFFGDQCNNKYRTATLKTNTNNTYLNTKKDKFYQLAVTGTLNTMKLTAEDGHEVQVISPYNLIAKDYVFNRTPASFKNIDETGSITAYNFNTSLIVSSASAVIHQIDDILQYESNP